MSGEALRSLSTRWTRTVSGTNARAVSVSAYHTPTSVGPPAANWVRTSGAGLAQDGGVGEELLEEAEADAEAERDDEEEGAGGATGGERGHGLISQLVYLVRVA